MSSRQTHLTWILGLAFLLYPGLLLTYPAPQDQKTSGPEVEQLIHRLHMGTWPERNRALNELLPYLPKSQAAQKAVIDICFKLGANPDWEDDNFIDYFTVLRHAVTEMATKTNDPAAWNALAVSSYNPDSPYARWLSTQEGAVHVLTRELDDKKYPALQGNAAYVLALSIAQQRYGCNDLRFHFSPEETKFLVSKIFRLAETNPGNDPVAYAQGESLLAIEFVDSSERQDVLRRIEESGSRTWVKETAHKIEAMPEEQIRKDACQAGAPA